VNVTRQEDLLQAILDDPADDAVRLVFADWLEDHSQNERAEFIRLQIELAGLSKGDKRRERMERRERALLRKHARAWFAPPRGWTVGEQFQVRRGFPEALHVLEEVIDKPELVAHWPITYLRAGELTDPELMRRLGESPFLARLRELDLYYVPIIRLEGLRTLLQSPHAANLVRLNLGSTFVGDAGARFLARHPCLPNLQSLDLGHIGITSTGLRALIRSKHRRSIRSLCLAGHWIVADDACAFLESDNWAGLSDFNLWATSLGDDGVRRLAACPGLARLTALNLNNNNITDAGARALAGSPYARNLRTLSLGINRITSKSAEVLLGSPYLQGLTRLQLAGNNRIPWQTRRRLQEHFGDRVSFDPDW
jgi:uncharacterized protein (TIGR02996 family)